MTAWQFTDVDREFFAREVEPFLPEKIFDAHAHLFCHEHYTGNTLPDHLIGTPTEIGLAVYRDHVAWLHGERTQGGLFFGLAFNGDRVGNDTFVAQEVQQGQLDNFKSLGQMIIAPEMEPELVRQEVRRHRFVGLKPYHTMATGVGPTWLAPIEAYLPEEHIRIAHEEGLTITLHMVRERALADPVNQATIRRYCENYPNMRLILAHAARGFNPWHTIEGIESLRGLDNVWFDTSAVTEAGGFEAIIETMGHERLLYGTDFYVSHMRGRCVAVGDSFHWFYAEDMNLAEKHTTLQPVLVGLESLRSLRLACRRLKLTDAQVEDIFYSNAADLFSF
ncbi:MAG: amidohydrolase family protein [Chloroflexi bacterium]|nr:amidohydrolase family protein [Chloroflexota bacterium]